MNAPPEMRGPAPALTSGMDRAGIVRSKIIDTASPESVEVAVARFVARRYRLTPSLATLICTLASVGARVA